MTDCNNCPDNDNCEGFEFCPHMKARTVQEFKDLIIGMVDGAEWSYLHKRLDNLIQAVRDETLTCKYCGHKFDQLYCVCDAFNDE